MASVRVFCTASTLPSVRDCLGFAAGAGEGVILAIDTDDIARVDADSPDWSVMRLLYREDAPPFTVTATRSTDADTNTDTHTDDAPSFREMRDRFTAALADNVEANAAEVRDHLAATRAIIDVALPPDGDEDTLEAVAWFTRIFVEESGGLLQADGEGFYDHDNDLILALP